MGRSKRPLNDISLDNPSKSVKISTSEEDESPKSGSNDQSNSDTDSFFASDDEDEGSDSQNEERRKKKIQAIEKYLKRFMFQDDSIAELKNDVPI
jgi:hypothetical protein